MKKEKMYRHEDSLEMFSPYPPSFGVGRRSGRLSCAGAVGHPHAPARIAGAQAPALGPRKKLGATRGIPVPQGTAGGPRGGRLLPRGRVVHNFLLQAFCYLHRAPSATRESQLPGGHAGLGDPHQEAAIWENRGKPPRNRPCARTAVFAQELAVLVAESSGGEVGESPGGARYFTGGGRAGEGFSCRASPLTRTGAVPSKREVKSADSPLVLITLAG